MRIQRSGSLASRDGRGRRWTNSKQQRRERHCPHCPQCPGGCWNTEDIYPKITKGRFDGLVIFRLKSADAAVTLLFVAKFTGWASRAGAMPSTAIRQWPSPTPESDHGGHRGYKFPGKPVKKASQSQALRSSEDSRPTRHPWPRSRCCTSSSSSSTPGRTLTVIPPTDLGRGAPVADSGRCTKPYPRSTAAARATRLGARPVLAGQPASHRAGAGQAKRCFAPSLRGGWTRAP